MGHSERRDEGPERTGPELGGYFGVAVGKLRLACFQAEGSGRCCQSGTSEDVVSSGDFYSYGRQVVRIEVAQVNLAGLGVSYWDAVDAYGSVGGPEIAYTYGFHTSYSAIVFDTDAGESAQDFFKPRCSAAFDFGFGNCLNG